MGLGGALIWSGLVHDIKIQLGKESVLLYECGIKNHLGGIRPSDHVMFHNNPNIKAILPKRLWKLLKYFYIFSNVEVVDMTNPEYLYWDEATDEKMYLKEKGHAIGIASKVHGIHDSLLQPKVYLSDEEYNCALSLLKEHNLEQGSYFCVEPNSNLEWTPNRAWIPTYWNELIVLLKDWMSKEGVDIPIVQVGAKDPEIRLEGAVDLTGQLSFRETGGIIKNSRMFITTEGGLGHLATAVNANSLMILSGYNPEELIHYPQNINMYHSVECSGCGLRTPCPNELKCMSGLTPRKVFEKIVSYY
tara:strand:- start:361 stop:1269 length:909 start_codon:yes stop_codon:yes gene_type:complete